MHNYDLLSYYLDTILEELKNKEGILKNKKLCCLLTLLSSFRTLTYNSYYTIVLT